MYILKACPKCHGDLVASSAQRSLAGEPEVGCLQCGYDMAPREAQRMLARLVRTPERPAARPEFVQLAS